MTARSPFDPLRLGPRTVPNRFIRAAAFEGLSVGHAVTRELIAFHRELAAGGVGMTTVAYAAVEQSGLAFEHQLWMRELALPGLAELARAVHAEGALASIQVGHTGNMSKAEVCGGRPIAPSSLPNPYGPCWPREMDADDIARVTASFGDAVRLAREAGFDAVELHFGHGYLVSQFVSPFTNRRTDAYGGSFEGRTRFLSEVLEAALEAARGEIAVVVKTNLRDGFDGGMELDEGVRVARLCEQGGADALVLSGGFVSRAPMFILRGSMPTALMGRLMPSWLMRVGVTYFGKLLVRTVPYEDLYFLEDARAVRAEVKLPLVYVGGVTSLATAQRALDAGFDGLAMARSLLVEPDFVRRLRREERAASACDHCNYCSARIYTTRVACKLREPPPAELHRLLEDDRP